MNFPRCRGYLLKPRATCWSMSRLSGCRFLLIPVSRQSMAIEPEQGSIEFPTAAILLNNTAKITLLLNHYINANAENAWGSYTVLCYTSLMVWVQRNRLVDKSQIKHVPTRCSRYSGWGFLYRIECTKVQCFISSTILQWLSSLNLLGA